MAPLSSSIFFRLVRKIPKSIIRSPSFPEVYDDPEDESKRMHRRRRRDNFRYPDTLTNLKERRFQYCGIVHFYWSPLVRAWWKIQSNPSDKSLDDASANKMRSMSTTIFFNSSTNLPWQDRKIRMKSLLVLLLFPEQNEKDTLRSPPSTKSFRPQFFIRLKDQL